MTNASYMAIKGARQGFFKGEHRRPAGSHFAGAMWIPVVDYSMSFNSPGNPRLEKAGGKGQHEPFSVTIGWGRWSAQIFSAVMNNEVLDRVILDFSSSNNSRCESYELIELTEVVATHVTIHSKGKTGQVQVVNFEYRRVDLETGHDSHKNKNTGSQREWEPPVFAYRI